MPSRRTLDALWFVALLLTPFAAFLPVLQNGFVNWDDPVTLIQNRYVHGLSWEGLRWAWTQCHLGEYRPFAWLAFALQYQLWGGSAVGYHAASLLWHVAATLMLGAVCLRLFERMRVPYRPAVLALVLVLFQVHPLRAEVVSWVSIQSYLPAVFFALLAVYLHMGESPRRMLWVAVCFAVSLCFKVVAVPLPLVLLGLDAVLGKREGDWKKAILSKVPLFALSLLFAWLAVWAKEKAGALEVGPERTLWSSLALPGFGLAFFLTKFVAPFGLRAVYSLPPGEGFSSPVFFASGGLVLLLAGSAFALRKKSPAFVLSVFAYGILLLPSLGVVRVNFALTADRYGYLPLLAFVPLVVAWLSRYPGKAEAALGVAVVALGFLTWRQTATWRSSLSLWTNVIESGDPSPQARNNLGSALTDAGDSDHAYRYFNEALRLKPDYADAMDNLGLYLVRKGRLADAEKKFSEALVHAPKKASIHGHLAVTRMEQGRAEEAVAGIEKALALSPEEPELWSIRGVMLARQKRFAEAARDFERVLALRPGDEQALRYLKMARESDRLPAADSN